MKILIKNVKSPACFWGIKDGFCASPRFQVLKEEINDYFGNDQLFKCTLANPVEGMKCVMQYEARNWQRAVVDAVMVTPYGCSVRCFLVDILEMVMASSNRLFASPSWVWEEPTQGIKFSLHGVVPACLWTDYHKDQVKIKSHSHKWDSSAIRYFKELVSLGSSQGSVDIISIDKNQVHDVYLYLSFSGCDPISAADMLINKKFALPLCEASPVDPPEPAIEIVKPDISQQSLEMRTSLDEVMKEVAECLNNSSSSSSASCHSSPRRQSKAQSALCSSAVHNPCEKSCNGKSLFDLSVSTISENRVNDLSSAWPEGCVARSHQFSNADSKISVESSQLSRSIGRGAKLNSLLCEIGETQPVGMNSGNVSSNSNGSLHKNVVDSQTSTSLIPVELQKKLEKIACLTKSDEQSNATLHDKSTARENILLMEKLLTEAKDMLNHVDEPVSTALVDDKQNSKDSLVDIGPLDRSSFDVENKNPVYKAALKETNSTNNKKHIDGPVSKKSASTSQITSSPFHGKKESFFTVQQPASNSTNKQCSILVKGIKPPNPYPLFCKTPFPSFITSLFEGLKFRGPTQVQAYVWPAIMEKRDVVALAPSGGGKTLAYVTPLVSILYQQHKTAQKNVINHAEGVLSSRQNPVIIVLCSSWKDIQNITDSFKSLLHQSNSEEEQYKVIGISGGPDVESKRAVELVAGCSVLVASLHTLIRICKAKYITLDRLEYLVLDNIHILVEEFTTEVREIMSLWSASLCDNDRTVQQRYKPKILGFGIQWTNGVKSFMDAYMSNPLLYINHPLEASVFGQVHHEVHIWSRKKSYECLMDVVQSTNSERSGGIAVFMQSAATMKKVVSALTCASIYCLGVEGSMMSIEMQEVQKLFDDDAISAPVLVITDSALKMLTIDNIEMSVHFELAKDKFTFGSRLGFMQYYYQMDSKAAKPCSHIFLTEENIGEVMGVVKLLQRLSQPIPQKLELLASQAVQSVQIARGQKALCPYMKAYGKCRDSQSCSHRHFVSKHLDSPNMDPKFAKVPTDGFVKVKITCVANATLFYGHVIKSSSTVIKTCSQFDTISSKLQEHFVRSENKQRLVSLPKFGQTFAFHKTEKFYRAILKRPQNQHHSVAWKSPAGVTKLQIHLVDTGQSCTATLDSLYHLPPILAAYPYQAIKIQACSVKPIDNDTEWSVEASEMVHDKIYDQIVEGNVVLALGHNIWLQPVLIRSNLPITALRVTDCDITAELIQTGLAEKNSTHVKNLLEECKDIIDQIGSSKTFPDECKSSKNVTANIETTEQSSSQAITKNVPSNTPAFLQNDLLSSKLKHASNSSGDHKEDPVKVLDNISNGCTSRSDETLSVCSSKILKQENLSNGYISHEKLIPSPLKEGDLKQENEKSDSECVALSNKNSLEIPITDDSSFESFSSCTEVDLCDIPMQKNCFEIPALVDSCEDDHHSIPSTLTSLKSSSSKSCTGGSVRLDQVKNIENKKVNSNVTKSTPLDLNYNPAFGNPSDMPSDSQGGKPEHNEFVKSESTSDCHIDDDLSPINSATEISKLSENTQDEKLVGEAISSHTEKQNTSPKALPIGRLSPSRADSVKPRLNTSQVKNALISGSQHQCAPTNKHPSNSQSDFSQKTDYLKEKDSKPSVKELKDIDANKACGLLHPICVQLAKSNDFVARQQLCQDLYMTTRERPFDVTERDLDSLNMILMDVRSDDEKVLILGSFLSLATANVPLSDCLSLKQLSLILKNMKNNEKVIKLIKSLGKMIIQNTEKDLLQSVKDLILYVNDMSSDVTESKQSIVFSLEMLDAALEENPSQLKDLEELDLAGLLIKVQCEELELVKRSLFVKIVNYNAEQMMKLKEEPDQTKKPIQAVEKQITNKVDCLNYDRFNDIDTDTLSLHSNRPYTPIPVKFDTDTDVESAATETDFDPHLFGI
uniref:RNA helicase n=1 Tax=Phallusia mammillata TaxID=59560 RepID=A0A6F9DH86_9ASCI|nr:uncharacterized protein LOC100179489 [Phallusia mammillata]